MVWSQCLIKILGVHFDNYVLDNSNWDKISHSEQTLVNKLWYISQIYIIPKLVKNKIEKKIAAVSSRIPSPK